MVGRREFLMAGAAGGAALFPGVGPGAARAYARASTDAGTGSRKAGAADTPVPRTPALEKFVGPLPVPPTAVPDPSAYPGADYYEVTMRQGSWRFHRDLGPATVWGYWAADPGGSGAVGMGCLGPTLVATTGRPTVVKYRNELPTTHLFQSVIDAIHDGDPRLTPVAPPPYPGEPPFPPNVNVWNVVHLHGGRTAPQSDGLPKQSYGPDGYHAEDYSTLDPGRAAPNEAICAYAGQDRSSMLWYHDHAMGMTTVNVYAGLAGLYLVRDPADDALGLPRGEFEVPLILQDRTFHPDGSLAYTMVQRDGEDTPVVNGKAYPFLEVEPRRYRLRVLNASNERFWRLRFDVPAGLLPQPSLPFWLIGTDAGLRAPLPMRNFLIGPAERYDLIVDFGRLPMGTDVTLTNYDARVHFPGGDGPEISDVMRFRVTRPLSGGGDTTTAPSKLKPPAVAPASPAPGTFRREWVVYQHKPSRTMTFNAVPFAAPSEDFVTAGATEIWEYVNLNHDAHPMHVHLVDFQVLDRQQFDAARYRADYEKWLDGGRRPRDRPVLANYLTGPPIPPEPDEALSRKDTVKAYPGTVTRIVVPRFSAPTGTIASLPGSGTEFPATYVHHCHLLEHEDNDLMRPWTIVAPGG